MKAFKSGFTSNQLPTNASFDGMQFKFAPMCPSTGKPVQLTHLAKSFGFSHFNWWQSVRDPGAIRYTVSTETYNKLLNGETFFTKAEFHEGTTDWVLDPILDSKGYYAVVGTVPATGGKFALPISKPEGNDNLPYYWDEPGEVKLMTSKYSLDFEDYPQRPGDWFAPERLQLDATVFITRVAGVRANGTFVIWSTQHNWINYKEDFSATSDVVISNKNPVKPEGYDNLPGKATYKGVTGLDIIVTPDLVGRSSDATSIQKYLSGSGFSMKVVGYQESPTVPDGIIISQTPESLTETSVRGEIQVVVSKSASQDCGSILNGQTTTRIRYLQSEVPYGSSCEEVKEVQTATCTNGTLTFSGAATFTSCSVKAPTACGAIPHGGTITRSMYSAASVPFGNSCESVKEEQVGTCNNGNLTFTGTASFRSCDVAPAASCGDIPHGGTTSRSMYTASSVPFGASCESVREEQVGTCYNGNLTFTGTAAFNSCDVTLPASCGDIPHDGTTTRTRYSSPTVPFGESCDSVKEEQTGTCFNGTLSFSGTSQYESCSVLPSVAVGCEKVKTEVCKAHYFESTTCKIPGTIVEVKVEKGYKGSQCQPAPKGSSFSDMIRLINTYSFEKDILKVWYGCDAKFSVKYIGKCNAKE